MFFTTSHVCFPARRENTIFNRILLNKTIRDSRQSAHRQKVRRHIAPPNRNTHDFVSFTAVKVQEIFQQEKKNIKIPTYFLRLSNKRVILFVH